MTVYTFGDIKTKVQRDLDLFEEVFVTDAEMLDLCNEAIDEAEAEILGIYESYFLDKEYLALTTGQAEYSLPSGIYATKIRKIIYNNGNLIYTIKRMKNKDMFEERVTLNLYPSDPRYRYILFNSATNGFTLELVPTSQETSAANVEIWYLRNAKKMTTETDEVDIPEAFNFIVQFMKRKLYEKEGHPNLQAAMAEESRQRKLLVDTLTLMTPDDELDVERDFTYYEEMS